MQIPGNVQEIGDYAFCETDVTYITIPVGVTRIGKSAFESCWKLVHVTVPDSVTEIGDYAFAWNEMTSVELPARFEENLGYAVFYGCPETMIIAHRAGAIDAPVDPVVATNFVEVVVTNTVTDHVAVTNMVKMTNFVDVVVMATNLVDVTVTNTVTDHVTLTNILEIAAEAAVVPEEVRASEPEAEAAFTGEAKLKMNGVVFDADGAMRGIMQVETAKATAKGVKVKGFVVLENGKKVAMKAVTVPVEEGKLSVSTAVGKLGTMSLVIGGNGFKGTFGTMKVVSADIGKDAGVLSGSLTLKHIDAKGKVVNQKISVGGVTTGGTAAGTITPKGETTKVFAAEFE